MRSKSDTEIKRFSSHLNEGIIIIKVGEKAIAAVSLRAAGKHEIYKGNNSIITA